MLVEALVPTASKEAEKACHDSCREIEGKSTGYRQDSYNMVSCKGRIWLSGEMVSR